MSDETVGVAEPVYFKMADKGDSKTVLVCSNTPGGVAGSDEMGEGDIIFSLSG